MKCFLLSLLLLFVPCAYYGQENSHRLNEEETAVLEKFFRVLTEDSELGYVLYDKKPVCIHGFFHKDPFIVKTPMHKQSVAIREGARIWRQLAATNADITIHVCDKEDPLIPGYIHVCAINIPLFHAAINENLPLFQYILGPATSSQGLLNALLSNSYGFHSLLKNDKVLVGKVLGFGIQNSLYVSRLENIQDAYGIDTPPFLNCESLTQYYEHEHLPCAPSFGFTSISDELNDFQKKIALSSEKLTNNNPEFIFGWLKDSKVEQKFVADLEKAQRQIQKLISSPNFLKNVFQKVSETGLHPSHIQKYQFQFENTDINKIIAKGIWESLQDYDCECLSYFIEGFDKFTSPPNQFERQAWFPDYRKEILEGQENLKIADRFFDQLECDESYRSIADKKLYYKIIKNGISERKCNSKFVSLSYSIFSPDGRCLANQNNVPINLENTISGFANGIKGMRVGETREIFIHPSIAYGFDTSLEKCSYLRGVVTLLDIHNDDNPIPPVKITDLSFLMDEDTLLKRDENYKMMLQEKGKQIAQHLQKCNAIDLAIVKNYLIQSLNNKEHLVTSQVEQDIINQVHWNIYYGS